MRGCFIDMTGQKAGKWLVLERAPSETNQEARWRCRCECGTITSVRGTHLRKGGSAQCRKCAGDIGKRRHGMSQTRIHKAWINMSSRCNNPNDMNYKRYGGRGIRVCGEWRNSFEAFWGWAKANGYRRHLTIERTDNDGDYKPSNCYWATWKQQSHNKGNNRYITINGEAKLLCECAEEYGIPRWLIYNRLKLGWRGKELLEKANTYRQRRKT